MAGKPLPAIDRVKRMTRYEDRGYMTLCLVWFGALTKGYGELRIGGRSGRRVAAHTITYEHFVGPVLEGMEIDHLCRQTDCCNHEHLEAVTHAENIRRGLAPVVTRERARSQTHCKQGHPFDESNTIWRMSHGYRARKCRACFNAGRRKAAA